MEKAHVLHKVRDRTSGRESFLLELWDPDGDRQGSDVHAGQTLLLDKRNKKIAGVCAGFARYFDMDVVLMRVLWLGVALCSGGVGFLVYLGAWIVIPSDSGLEGREMAFPPAQAG